MLDSQLFGLDPGRMHLVNLLLHIANTLLLFAFLRKMTGSLWPSTFVAAAFAVHPMHVESVAWIVERKDVLSTLFWILTLLAYVSYVKRPAAFRYLATITIFAIGLLAKPMLVTLPFVLLLLDYWPLERIRGQRTEDRKQKAEGVSQKLSTGQLIVEKIPFLALAAVWSVITFLAQRGSGSVSSISAIPLAYRIANSFLSYARYIGKLFWPQNMSVFYPLDIVHVPIWRIALCVLLLLVISILAIRFGRKQRYLPTGWFWFVVTLIPVIGLVQSGAQGYADRYTYIPYIGLFIVIAWGLPELLSKWRYREIALGMTAAIALTASGVCAYIQAGYWRDSFTVFTHALEVTQNNSVAHDCLANDLRDHGKIDLAIEHYKKAIQFDQSDSMALNNLGYIMNDRGDVNKAIEYYQKVIKIRPDYAEAYNNLGFAMRKQNNVKQAIEYFQMAIKLKPDYAEAHYNLGVNYYKLERYQDAIDEYRQTIRIKPDWVEAHYNLGNAYDKLGRYQDEIESYKQAIRIKPDLIEAHYNLGFAYGKLGRSQEAVESYKQAIRIKPDFTMAHYALGITYLATGDKEAALEEYKILKTLDAEQANKLFDLINK
jgi:tetratricopeptide (TPR) repeat protein